MSAVRDAIEARLRAADEVRAPSARWDLQCVHGEVIASTSTSPPEGWTVNGGRAAACDACCREENDDFPADPYVRRREIRPPAATTMPKEDVRALLAELDDARRALAGALDLATRHHAFQARVLRVKAYREATRAGLKEALDAINALDKEHPPGSVDLFLEARNEGIREGIRMAATVNGSTPFPLLEVLRILCDLADHTLDTHSCDHHGYEVWSEARHAGRECIRELTRLATEPDPKQLEAPLG